MLISIARVVLLSVTLLDAKLTTLDGRTLTGVLQQMNSDTIVLKTSADDVISHPTDEVIDMTLTSADAASPSTDVLQIVLRDGSQLSASEISASAENISGSSAVLGDFRLPRSLVRAVQLKEIGDESESEWNTFLQRSNERDLLIVGKRDGTGLDFLAGIVTSVGAEEVPFLLDGDEIPVPRSRVFGVVFAAVKSEGRKQTGLTLELADGSVVRASSAELQGDRWQVQSSWGSSLTLNSDLIQRIDFSSSRLHYLSDLEPLAERYFGMDPPGREWGILFEKDVATRTGLSSQWRMSRDRFPNNGRPPLSLQQKVYRKGLCIFPKAQIDYAVDDQYSRLTAVVGVDDEVAWHQRPGQPPTAVELVITSDGNEVFRRLISALEAPVLLDIDLTGVTTLSIVVDFGDNSSVCDYLDLADARLIVNSTK